MRKSAVVGVVVGIVWGIYSSFIEIFSLLAGGGLHIAGYEWRIIFFPGWVLDVLLSFIAYYIIPYIPYNFMEGLPSFLSILMFILMFIVFLMLPILIGVGVCIPVCVLIANLLNILRRRFK